LKTLGEQKTAFIIKQKIVHRIVQLHCSTAAGDKIVYATE